jgi:hypothetical protein
MQKFRVVLKSSLVLLTLTVSVLAFRPPALDATAGNKGITAGTKINFTIGGDGCNCRGAQIGTAGASGSATVTFHLGSCVPNAHCRVFATALDESGGKKYKGSGTISSTASGSYSSTFSLSAY